MNASGSEQLPPHKDKHTGPIPLGPDAGHEAVTRMFLAMYRDGLRHLSIRRENNSIQVTAGDKALADEGWSGVSFADVHRKLSIMGGHLMPPLWLRALYRRRFISLQSYDWIEHRFWRPRLPAGETDLRINDLKTVLKFRVVDADRIDMDMIEV